MTDRESLKFCKPTKYHKITTGGFFSAFRTASDTARAVWQLGALGILAVTLLPPSWLLGRVPARRPVSTGLGSSVGMSEAAAFRWKCRYKAKKKER